MKTRNDFVSNSSSSGFLVFLDKKLDKNSEEDVDYLKNLLYNDEQYIQDYCDDEEVYSSKRLSRVILEDLEEASDEDLLKFFENNGDDMFFVGHGWKENFGIQGIVDQAQKKFGYPDRDLDTFRKLPDAEKECSYKEEEEQMKVLAQELLKLFRDKFKNKIAYLVEFSDNDGDPYPHLEHGSTFQNIPSFKVSHH